MPVKEVCRDTDTTDNGYDVQTSIQNLHVYADGLLISVVGDEVKSGPLTETIKMSEGATGVFINSLNIAYLGSECTGLGGKVDKGSVSTWVEE